MEVRALLASDDRKRLSVVLETVDFEGQPVGLLNELLLNDGSINWLHSRSKRLAIARRFLSSIVPWSLDSNDLSTRAPRIL